MHCHSPDINLYIFSVASLPRAYSSDDSHPPFFPLPNLPSNLHNPPSPSSNPLPHLPFPFHFLLPRIYLAYYLCIFAFPSSHTSSSLSSFLYVFSAPSSSFPPPPTPLPPPPL